MQHLKDALNTDALMFPLLIDRTKISNQENEDSAMVVAQSFDIVTHLWENYGESVVPTNGLENSSSPRQRRPDQIVNSSTIPFALRFLLLSTPSYLRPWPRCGVMRFNSKWCHKRNSELVLYQSEGCPESRLVREVLCSLEIPYLSIPVAEGSSNQSLLRGEFDKYSGQQSSEIPVLVDPNNTQAACLVGADKCVDYLWNQYGDDNRPSPTWLDRAPGVNLGRQDGSLSVGAYTAFLKGSRAFVPEQAMA
jgi:hypothetical protein